MADPPLPIRAEVVFGLADPAVAIDSIPTPTEAERELALALCDVNRLRVRREVHARLTVLLEPVMTEYVVEGFADLVDRLLLVDPAAAAEALSLAEAIGWTPE